MFLTEKKCWWTKIWIFRSLATKKCMLVTRFNPVMSFWMKLLVGIFKKMSDFCWSKYHLPQSIRLYFSKSYSLKKIAFDIFSSLATKERFYEVLSWYMYRCPYMERKNMVFCHIAQGPYLVNMFNNLASSLILNNDLQLHESLGTSIYVTAGDLGDDVIEGRWGRGPAEYTEMRGWWSPGKDQTGISCQHEPRRDKTIWSRQIKSTKQDAAILTRQIVLQSRAEQSRAEQSRAEQSRAEQSRAEQSRAEQSRAEQSRAEQSNYNHYTPQTYLVVGLWIGSLINSSTDDSCDTRLGKITSWTFFSSSMES